jgi:hypothetical protein
MSKKQKRRPRRAFIEEIDSYSDEYASWKKTKLVKRLVGVFEVPQEQFALPYEELLASLGLADYTIVRYAAEYDSAPGGDEPITGTGCTIALRNVYGKIVPAVFVRQDVQAVGETSQPQHPQFADAIRLLVLLHELGHADDISKGINYDHETLWVDLPAAEAYAHAFLSKQAQRHNYPALLGVYLENLERMARSPDDAQRLGAERFLANGKADELRAWIAERKSQSGLMELIERSGRAEEFIREREAP